MKDPVRVNWLIAAGLALFLYVALMSTANDFGLTYDEGIYMSRSGMALEWLGLLATDPGYAVSDAGIAEYWDARDEQPGVVKLIGALGQATFGRFWGGFAQGRAGTALLFALCAAGLFLFAARLYGRTVGLYAALALFTLPEVFAHAHLCALDVPIMATMLLATLLIEAGSRREGWGLVILGGCVFGVALGCKINALFVPLYLLPWLFLFRRKAVLKSAASLAVFGPVSFWLSWPWLWHDTLSRARDYFLFHLHHYPVNVTYFGVIYQYAPWHYPIVTTVLKTPPVTLVLVVVGLVGAVRGVCRAGAGTPPPNGETAGGVQAPALHNGPILVLIVAAAVVNIGINSLPSAPKYTGTRLWMPFYPFWALFAALGLRAILRLVWARVKAGEGLLTPQRLGWLVAALAIALPLRTLATVHPWEMSYYNALIGGTYGAQRHGMEITYWGDAYLHPLLWLNEHAAPGATVWIEPVGMLSICRMYQVGIVRDDLRLIAGPWPPGGPGRPAGPDYVVFQNKDNEWTPVAKALLASGAPTYAEALDGVPIFYVYDRKAIHAAHIPE